MTDQETLDHMMPERAREIKWAITEATKPVMTVDDLAEELDVSRQTIHDHKEELEDDQSIKIDKIGQATVFYHRAEVSASDIESYQNSWRSHLYGKRGMWLDAVEEAKISRRSNGESVEQRVKLWEALERHPWNSTDAYHPTVVTKERFEENPEKFEYESYDESPYAFHNRANIPPSAAISEDTVRAYDEHIQLFESEWFGEIVGLGGLLRFKTEMRRRLREGNEGDGEYELRKRPLTEFDDERLDELLPTIPEIIMAGEAADDLFCEMFGVEWG